MWLGSLGDKDNYSHQRAQNSLNKYQEGMKKVQIYFLMWPVKFLEWAGR